MIALISALNEAMKNVETWRNKYSRQEYPHKMVLNIMYRAYSTRLVYQAFDKQELADGFEDFQEASQYIIEIYSKAALEVHPNLLGWMKNQPYEEVGTVCTARYEKLATKAETDDKSLEEVEFSYIFEMLNDMCVLYFIAMRLRGDTDVEAIAKMTDIMIEPLGYMDYTITKQVFQQLLVAKYMSEHYRPLPK